MEGAAMGKPLLASNVRGCREVVVPGKGGHLVPVRSPEPLAEAMLELAADGAAREAQGRFNRSRACEEYDLRQVITRIEAVYHQLLGS
jgi:glycosyltransferase involved in cell wall biosynthesis